jgi:hypothetical protein
MWGGVYGLELYCTVQHYRTVESVCGSLHIREHYTVPGSETLCSMPVKLLHTNSWKESTDCTLLIPRTMNTVLPILPSSLMKNNTCIVRISRYYFISILLQKLQVLGGDLYNVHVQGTTGTCTCNIKMRI